jgi:hypothetical protein
MVGYDERVFAGIQDVRMPVAGDAALTSSSLATQGSKLLRIGPKDIFVGHNTS